MHSMFSEEALINAGVDAAHAARLVAAAATIACEHEPAVAWSRISTSLLTPAMPFEVHQHFRDRLFPDWGGSDAVCPLWTPSAEVAGGSNTAAVMREHGFADYAALQRRSVTDPESFWGGTLDRLGIRFRTPPARMLDPDSSVRSPHWLPGAELNIVESCFQASADATAILFGKASGQRGRMSYGELDTLSNRFAGTLRNEGFRPGDTIAVVIDMTPDSVAAYLGIVKAGCAAVSIAESFAAPEIAKRLRITRAGAVITRRCLVRGGKVLPLYEKVIQADGPRTILLDDPDGAGTSATPLRTGDVSWRDVLSTDTRFDVQIGPAQQVINILFSSGTTGDPKAIPWDQVTPIKCASDGHYHHDIHPGDVVCWPTSLGWMMGPWLIFATLINRGTVALFDEVPTGRAFGEFVADAGVTMLGVVPSLVRHWRAGGCMKGLEWSRIRAFSSTGECSNPDDMHYLMHLAGYRPIIEYCGGTEIGGGYITSTVIQPNVPSAFSGPALGSELVILDESGAPSKSGELFLVPPGLGLSGRLINADHDAVYFDGTPPGPCGETLRRHGDVMRRLPGGFFRAHGRADDTMNLGGIKVSSAEIERILLQIPGIRECAAIAVPSTGGGPDRLVIFAGLSDDADEPAGGWLKHMQQVIRSELNPLFRLADVRMVERLPRTASNKVMRRLLRSEYETGGGGTIQSSRDDF